MDVHPILVPVLKDIRFASRYTSLCEKYCDFKERLKDYDRDQIRVFYEQKGLKVSFVKRERFFKVVEIVGDYKVQFNTIPENGFLQFVLDVLKDKERYNLGWGMWESITKELTGSDAAKKPIFRDEKELTKILEEAISIYDDFKKGLFASQS